MNTEMQTHNLLAKNLPPYPLGQGIWYTILTVTNDKEDI